MPTYNVLVAVVDLVDAETPDEAIQALRLRLASSGFAPHFAVRTSGFDPYDSVTPSVDHAFLSDVDTEGYPQ